MNYRKIFFDEFFLKYKIIIQTFSDFSLQKQKKLFSFLTII